MTGDEMDIATKGLSTKSAKIRALARLGATRSSIADYLGIRYQHVRNVLVQPAPASEAIAIADAHTDDQSDEARALTIEQAKWGLSRQFGVPISAIEITIRG